MIRTVLVDDHAMVREALAQILDDVGDIEVIGQGGDLAAAQGLVRDLRPDVLVLDYNLPGGATLDVIDRLARDDRPRIVVLTVHESIHYAVRVLEAGAHGFVVKSGAVEDLEAAIRAAHAGDVYVSKELSQKVLQTLRGPRVRPRAARAADEQADPSDPPAAAAPDAAPAGGRLGPEALSPRELELLRRLGAGMSLKDAAADLHISPSTASTYRARLAEKLELRTTAELIRFALENGLVG